MAEAQSTSFGERLRQERKIRHWKQEQLAEKIGVSVPSINRWEHDRAAPRSDVLNLLIKLFGKSPEDWGISRQVRWSVPFLRNPYFTGREQIFLRLHKILTANNTVALSQTRAISGLGGIGKTQTALEYAYRYANEYEAVLWVRAASRESLTSDFAELATVLNLSEKEEADQFRLIAAVKRWLETNVPWLLIFDNADDLTLVHDFLPRRPGGAVLLTTRSQITGPFIKKIELEQMSREEGVTFLLRHVAPSKDGDGEESLPKEVSDSELHAAEEIWKLMDGLPLALDQAAAYIEENQCSLVEYLTLYHVRRNVLLQRRGSLRQWNYPDSVATTWLLSFRQIEQANPAVSDLLQLCAFLHPDAIPEWSGQSLLAAG
jgi:transcriptional regulator with XRE-family HTH domain